MCTRLWFCSITTVYFTCLEKLQYHIWWSCSYWLTLMDYLYKHHNEDRYRQRHIQLTLKNIPYNIFMDQLVLCYASEVLFTLLKSRCTECESDIIEDYIKLLYFNLFENSRISIIRTHTHTLPPPFLLERVGSCNKAKRGLWLLCLDIISVELDVSMPLRKSERERSMFVCLCEYVCEWEGEKERERERVCVQYDRYICFP